MSVSVNIREIRALTRRAERRLDDVDSVMDEVVDDVIQELRETDPYKNHTHNLRGSTQAETITFGDVSESTMAMAMPYASFVIDRGFSNWPDAVIDAETRMGLALSAIANRIIR